MDFYIHNVVQVTHEEFHCKMSYIHFCQFEVFAIETGEI